MPQEDTIKRFGRVLSIIAKLSSGPVKIADLAKEFKKEKRTLQRDFAMLHKAGFFTQTCGDGCYRFADGICVKNRPLNNEQFTALNAMAAFTRNAGAGLSSQFDRLFLHLTAGQPFETFIVPVMPRIISDTIPYIKDIEEGIEYNKELEIEYQQEGGQLKTHRICPLKVLVADGFAYIFSTYRERPDIFPKYRIDRIKSLKIIDGPAPFREPEGAKRALEHARSIWGAMPDKDRKQKIKLKVEGFARDYYRRHELIGGQVIKEQKDGTLIFEAKVGRLPEIIPHVLRWIPHVTVLGPKELREDIKKRVAEFSAKQN